MTEPRGVEVAGPMGPRYDEILTPEALRLVATLQRELGPRRAELLAARAGRQRELSAGARSSSCPRPGPSGRTPPGGWRRRRRGWSTGGSRSPGRPTGR